MSPEFIKQNATVLIVDDHPENVRVLKRLLERDGYAGVWTTTESQEALEIYERLRPDLLVLDLNMPPPDGYAILEQISSSLAPTEYMPVLVLTGDLSAQATHGALALGAKDYLTKPFEPAEVYHRVRNVLQTRFLHLALQMQNQSLDEQVSEKTRQLEAAHSEILQRLAYAAEFRDHTTGKHTHRVGDLSGRIADTLGLPEESVDLIRRAAPLHDLGKIGVPDAILLKAGPLTAEDWEVMKGHTTIGEQMLAGGDSELIRLAATIARSHHERWDGVGYPDGLREHQIPLAARIVAVADVFDALLTDRPYRTAWDPERVLESIQWQSGSHFDPEVVDAFLQVIEGTESLFTAVGNPA